MDQVKIEKYLYRILRGRLRYNRDGLVLYIHEPTPDLIDDSYEIYDEAYEKAFMEGCYINKEILAFLIEQNLWTPHDDREAEKIEKEIEEKKKEAYKNYMKPKELRAIKKHIYYLKREATKYRVKKHKLDHVTCEGNASAARWGWLISNCTYTSSDKPYDWRHVSASDVLHFYEKKALRPEIHREIARTEPWRGMWLASTKGRNQLFGKPSIDLTRDQSALCAYSSLYDNVYENPDRPPQEVINDDDCLDGWFLVENEKADKERKKSQSESLITNEKIANSQEVFLMAQNEEDAQNIFDMNTSVGRSKIAGRQRTLHDADGDKVKHAQLPDVQQDIMVQQNQEFLEKFRR